MPRLALTAVVALVGALLSAAGMTGATAATSGSAAAAQRHASAAVSHPQDDHAGSTIVAHEGRAAGAGPASEISSTWRVRGMDVSHWQGSIDWPAVYAEGGRFVYIKATESTTFIDGNFVQNYRDSANAGLIRGAYHFALPDRSSGGRQADYFVNHGGGWGADGLTLPPMLDIEYNPYGETCYGLSPSAMVSWLHAFSNRVHYRTSRYPTIYTTTNWWVTCTGNNGSFGGKNPLFIARWSGSVGTLPAGWGTYALWQYANSGIFPGDQDRFNGGYDRLRYFAATATATR